MPGRRRKLWDLFLTRYLISFNPVLRTLAEVVSSPVQTRPVITGSHLRDVRAKYRCGIALVNLRYASGGSNPHPNVISLCAAPSTQRGVSPELSPLIVG